MEKILRWKSRRKGSMIFSGSRSAKNQFGCKILNERFFVLSGGLGTRCFRGQKTDYERCCSLFGLIGGKIWSLLLFAWLLSCAHWIRRKLSPQTFLYFTIFLFLSKTLAAPDCKTVLLLPSSLKVMRVQEISSASYPLQNSRRFVLCNLCRLTIAPWNFWQIHS